MTRLGKQSSWSALLHWPLIGICRLHARQTAANSSSNEQPSCTSAGESEEVTSQGRQHNCDLPRLADGCRNQEKLWDFFSWGSWYNLVCRQRARCWSRTGMWVHQGSAFSCLNCPSPLTRVQESGCKAESLAPAGTGQVLLQHWLMAEPEQCL